jgi:hypothetical protein
MTLLDFDLPGVTSQHYDQPCRSLNHGTPLRTRAEFWQHVKMRRSRSSGTDPSSPSG